MKVPVVVATGVGVVITGGLVLIVPAINKDIAYIDKMITNIEICKIQSSLPNAFILY